MLALVVDQNSFYSDAEDSSDDCSISDEGLLEKLDSKEGLIAAQLAIGNLIRASLNQGDSNITCMQLEDDRICEIFEDDDVSLVAGNTICIKKKSWLLPKKMKHGMEKIGSKLFKKTQSNSVSVFESGAIATVK